VPGDWRLLKLRIATSWDGGFLRVTGAIIFGADGYEVSARVPDDGVCRWWQRGIDTTPGRLGKMRVYFEKLLANRACEVNETFINRSFLCSKRLEQAGGKISLNMLSPSSVPTGRDSLNILWTLLLSRR
jgi:hypothetical protein